MPECMLRENPAGHGGPLPSWAGKERSQEKASEVRAKERVVAQEVGPDENISKQSVPKEF